MEQEIRRKNSAQNCLLQLQEPIRFLFSSYGDFESGMQHKALQRVLTEVFKVLAEIT